MNNKIIVGIIVVIVIIGGLFMLKDRAVAPIENEVNSNMPVPGSVAEEKTVENLKEFSIDAVPFSFTPSTMVVNNGDTIKITVKNVNGTHDLKIDEFNASTRILKSGETETITFVADKVGTFQYYCSVGNHRAMGMVGNLTVR